MIVVGGEEGGSLRSFGCGVARVGEDRGGVWVCSDAKEGLGVTGLSFIRGEDGGNRGGTRACAMAWTAARVWHCGEGSWWCNGGTGATAPHWRERSVLAR